MAGMRDLCMHLASTADNACDDDEAEQSRGCASPVEMVLAGRVAVGGVPAVEFPSRLVKQPLDDLDVEPGDGGEVLGGAAAGEGPHHRPEGVSRQCIALAVASQTLVRSSS